jgi:hypothetical protein
MHQPIQLEEKKVACECCKHLPELPSNLIAQQTLIKQLNLFLELEALFTNKNLYNYNSKANLSKNVNNQSKVNDEFVIQQSTSNHSFNKSIITNKIDKEEQKDQFNENILKDISRNDIKLIDNESDVESNFSNNLIDHFNLNKIEKLKPLIPNYLYEEKFFENNTQQQKLLSNNEPLIGREWIFKEIEKVSFFFI